MVMIEQNNNRVESSTDADSHERRRHARYPFTATVETVESKSQTRIQGRTSDLSRGGCYVDANSSFPAGSLVKMRLTKEMRTFEAQAEVVYSLAGMGMGLKFVDTNPGQFETVEKWMAELSGEMLPQPELTQPSDPSSAQQRPGNEEYLVLNELVMELKRQGVLSNEKCDALLQKLDRTGRGQSNSGLA
jgi:hypothetical protein